MVFGPALRKLVLTVHIGASVAWIGAVVAYLPLDVLAATSDDPARLRAAYLGMQLIARWALVPLAVAALVTGVAISLGTPWGLFRHYWVVLSLALTVLAYVVLRVETRVIDAHAAVAADPASTDAAVVALTHTLPHSVGGLVVLLVVLALNVYKPRGLTRHGWRKQQASLGRSQDRSKLAREP